MGNIDFIELAKKYAPDKYFMMLLEKGVYKAHCLGMLSVWFNNMSYPGICLDVITDKKGTNHRLCIPYWVGDSILSPIEGGDSYEKGDKDAT